MVLLSLVAVIALLVGLAAGHHVATHPETEPIEPLHQGA
jgi:hypothetical protein